MIIRRESRTGANDLNTVYRPCKLDELLGNSFNVKILKAGVEDGTLPHTHLFSGPPGCGKTTAARILALGLNCEGSEQMTTDPCLVCDSCLSILNHSSIDVVEINVGQSGGKDAVDSIVKNLDTSPFQHRYKILIFDEAHELSRAAQALLLKVIEDGYGHVFFMFCTNHPEKLIIHDDDAFVQRCSMMHFDKLSDTLIMSLLDTVCQSEAIDYKTDVLRYIADEAEGVPRRALVWLQQVIKEGSWDLKNVQEVVGIITAETQPELIELNRMLIKGEWRQSLALYNKLKKVSVESIRRSVSGYVAGCLVKSSTIRQAQPFSEMLDVLKDPIYDTSKAGRDRFLNNMFKIIEIVHKYRR